MYLESLIESRKSELLSPSELLDDQRVAILYAFHLFRDLFDILLRGKILTLLA